MGHVQVRNRLLAKLGSIAAKPPRGDGIFAVDGPDSCASSRTKAMAFAYAECCSSTLKSAHPHCYLSPIETETLEEPVRKQDYCVILYLVT